MASFFSEWPRVVSRSKTRIDQWQAFMFFNNIQAFPRGGEKTKLRRILHEPIGGTLRHVCRNFHAKNRRSDLPVFNIEQNLARKLDPRLKPSNLKETAYIFSFIRIKVQTSTPF